jgi:hypothetical protein
LREAEKLLFLIGDRDRLLDRDGVIHKYCEHLGPVFDFLQVLAERPKSDARFGIQDSQLRVRFAHSWLIV